MLEKPLRSKLLEPVLVFIATLTLWAICTRYELFEALAEFLNRHEAWQLDELFVALVMLGIAGVFNSYRYYLKQHEETKRRLLAENNLEWLSRHDSLTGLPNRRFLNQFSDEIGHGLTPTDGKQYGLLSIHLDGLKKANDLLGNAGGDKLLCQVAQQIKNGDSIKMVFRIGGVDFLALVDLKQTPNLDDIAKKLWEEIDNPIQIDGFTNKLKASIGLARYPQDGENLAGVAHNSELAMDCAKQSNNKGIVAFDETMLASSVERSLLEQELLAAIDNGEIKPHYQPLIDLKTNELRGFEALARWSRRGEVPISPEKFIPIAEDLGVITKLSEKLLFCACGDAKSWPNGLVLSFNLSPVQLSDRLLGRRIVSILDAVELARQRVEIEVTESSVANDVGTAGLILKDLNKAGVRTALDDFGTGYSNLSQLSQFCFDRIKIDRSFVANFESDDKQMRIVKSILSLSQALGLRTTAEGIEEIEQASILRELGCEIGQGYLFGKPINAEQTIEFINNHLDGTEEQSRTT